MLNLSREGVPCNYRYSGRCSWWIMHEDESIYSSTSFIECFIFVNENDIFQAFPANG